MQAVGHFDEKLSNKNRNLIKESMFKKNVLCIDSPWYDQGLDPPPASIGNTFIWRRPKICPVAPVAAATGTSGDFQRPSNNVNAGAERVADISMNDDLNGNLRPRRLQMFSCCSQAAPVHLAIQNMRSREQDMHPMQKNDAVDARHFLMAQNPIKYEREPDAIQIRE